MSDHLDNDGGSSVSWVTLWTVLFSIFIIFFFSPKLLFQRKKQRSKIIIGFCGLKGAGKDMSAQVLGSYGFKKASFAGLLKDIVAVAFGFNRDMLEGTTQKARTVRKKVDGQWAATLSMPRFTPVKALQLWGTDLVRNHFHAAFWALSLFKNIDENQFGPRVAVTDVRYPNEAAMVTQRGGVIVRLERGEPPAWYAQIKQAVAGRGAGPEWYERMVKNNEPAAKVKLDFPDMPHESEWRSIGCEDFVVLNNGSTNDLRLNLVRELLDRGYKL